MHRKYCWFNIYQSLACTLDLYSGKKAINMTIYSRCQYQRDYLQASSASDLISSCSDEPRTIRKCPFCDRIAEPICHLVYTYRHPRLLQCDNRLLFYAPSVFSLRWKKMSISVAAERLHWILFVTSFYSLNRESYKYIARKLYFKVARSFQNRMRLTGFYQTRLWKMLYWPHLHVKLIDF